jgi:hypothetical protein
MFPRPEFIQPTFSKPIKAGPTRSDSFVMREAIKKVISQGIFPDVFSVKRSSDSEVRSLISRLKPQDCGTELIRIGGDADGGYLIPDDLEGIEYCFSPGVNVTSNFEQELADRGIQSFLADYSVESPPIERPEFVFDKKFLGATDREHYFTLDTWKKMRLGGYEGDLILQMDIEGAEYEVILSTSPILLAQFRIVVIEFHALDRIFDPFTFKIISACFDKLLEAFCVVHIHPNNCCAARKFGSIEVPSVMEFTLLNRKRAKAIAPRREFPHRLDIDNIPGAKPLVLPRCWYAPD